MNVKIYIVNYLSQAMTDRKIEEGKRYKKLNVFRMKSSFLSEIKAFFMIFEGHFFGKNALNIKQSFGDGLFCNKFPDNSSPFQLVL